jgi:hypothetical protein
MATKKLKSKRHLRCPKCSKKPNESVPVKKGSGPFVTQFEYSLIFRTLAHKR